MASSAEPHRRVLYSGMDEGDIDRTYFNDVDTTHLFPVVTMADTLDQGNETRIPIPTRLQTEEYESKDANIDMEEGNVIRREIKGNESIQDASETGVDAYLAMLSECTAFTEAQLAPSFIPTLCDDVDDEGLGDDTPQSETPSPPADPTPIVYPDGTVPVPVGPPERIQIVKQSTDDWGEYHIDKYGRIVSPSSPSAEKAVSSPTFNRPSVSNSNPRSTSVALTATPSASALKQAAALRERELRREQKWVDMLEDWDRIVQKKPTLLKRRLRKGIPGSMRGAVWPRLLDLETARKSHPPMYYFDLLRRELPLGDDRQIRKDLPRLMQDHVMFRSPEAGSRTVMCTGQALLYNVLKAYAVHDPKVGYVQGMDSLAAPALLYFPEETAFWYLERMLNAPEFALRGLYVDQMPRAHRYVHTHTRLVERYLPALAKAFGAHGVEAYSYAFRWYTLRFGQFSPELSLRVMDIYLHEGDKILYRMALALLAREQKRLLALAKTSPEDLLHALSALEHDMASQSSDAVDALVEAACGVKLTRAELDKLAQEWQREQGV